MPGEITYKEILRQPDIFKSVLAKARDIKSKFDSLVEKVRADEIFVTGCGSSYYLAQVIASLFNHFLRIPTRAIPSSELFLYPDDYFTNSGTMVVGVSRSGDTTETVKALEMAKNKGLPTVALTCYEDSTIAKKADYAFISEEAKEESVVMTGSFSSMLLIAYLMVADDSNIIKLPELAKAYVEKFEDIARRIIQDNSIKTFVYLGSGPYYGLANESMLKAKEMSISNSEGYHTLEFRHGPKSIVDNNMLVTAFISDTATDYELKLLKEIKGYGAVTCAIGIDLTDEHADYPIAISKELDQWARLPLCIMLSQFIAYYNAVKKGINCDRPQHLDQVVKL